MKLGVDIAESGCRKEEMGKEGIPTMHNGKVQKGWAANNLHK